MIRCKVNNLLFRLFPVRSFQGFLIKKHFDHCTECQKTVAKKEEAHLFLVGEEKAGEMVRLWPGINERLGEDKPAKARTVFFPRWRWALSAVALAVIMLTGLWYVNITNQTDLAVQMGGDMPFEINYIKIEEKPAGAFVYEPQDSEMIIVWAEILP